MREVNQSSLLLPTSSATRWERPDLRMPAMRDTEKSSCWAASITLARVLAGTPCQGGERAGDRGGGDACLPGDVLDAGFHGPSRFFKVDGVTNFSSL